MDGLEGIAKGPDPEESAIDASTRATMPKDRILVDGIDEDSYFLWDQLSAYPHHSDVSCPHLNL
jgi:hypothetical protein